MSIGHPVAVQSQSWSRWLDRLVFLGLLVLLVLLPLPFGGHRPWVEALLVFYTAALLVGWSLSLLLAGSAPGHLDKGLLVMALCWLLWLGWIVLSIQPLALEQIAEWSPQRWSHLQALAPVVDGMASSAALSLDAELTRRKLLLSAAYAALFLLVIVTLRRRRRFVWLLWVLVLSGLAQTAYGSLMVLSGMELGAWGPKDAYRGFATGTFVNRNHFAGYLELCIGAAVALIMVAPMRAWAQSDWRQRLRRLLMLLQDGPLLARVAIALFFIGLILSQSRMGNVAAVAGLCAMALLNMLFRRRRSGALRSMVFVASILLIDIWLFGHWFGLEELAERYGQLETTVNMRAEVLEDLRAMIPAYATTGSGLGTFALAYPEFRSPEVAGFYDHAHNDYAQFLIETGVPGTALLAMLVLLTAGRALLILRRRRDPLARGVACGALTAMVAIGVHSAADFNLQIPANVVTLLTLMAAVWAVRTSRTERADRAPQMG